VSVIVSADLPCPIPGLEGVILMWSKCRKCECSTPVTLLSEESSRFSFAKYLELTFYHSYVRPRASLCNCNMYKDYSRFFSLHGMTVKFEYDSINLVEVRVPPLKLYLAANSTLKLQYIETLRQRINTFYDRYLSFLFSFVV
jgi:1-phosphatidylinositol-3-phosphate 5-kinase